MLGTTHEQALGDNRRQGLVSPDSRARYRPATRVDDIEIGVIRTASDQPPTIVFMIVPALVATAPPSMAPATIFGEFMAPPFHFSHAKRPPP